MGQTQSQTTTQTQSSSQSPSSVESERAEPSLNESISVSIDSEELSEAIDCDDEPCDRPSDWLLVHTIALCMASYDENPTQTLCSSDFISHSFNKCSVSDQSCYDGRVIVAEATDPDGTEYHFVCFRGTVNWNDVQADINASPQVCELGVVHTGFLERSKVVPIRSLFEACRNKKVVITGHSLGGACATLLAARFFSAYSHYGYDDNQVTVITFGSPLVAGPSFGSYMKSRKRHFHNFIVGHDIVPRVLTVMKVILPSVAEYLLSAASLAYDSATIMQKAMDSLTLFKHFGNFYHLDIHRSLKGNHTVECSVMSTSEIKSFFEDVESNRSITDQMITDHSMVIYKNALWHGAIDPQKIHPHHILRVLPTWAPPDIRYCSIRDLVLYVYGSNMIYAVCCELWSSRLPVVATDNTWASFQCSSQVAKRLQRSAGRFSVDVAVVDLFGSRSGHKDVSCRLQSASTVLTPDKVLSNVLPLVSLLVRADDGSQEYRAVDSVLGLMYSECVSLGQIIPIEFAFRTMESNYEGDDDVVVTTFLNRVRQVDMDWTKLCSDVMVTTIMNSIRRLHDKSLNEEQITQRYRQYSMAFGKFMQDGAMPCVDIEDKYFIANEFVDTRDRRKFWHTICVEGIEVVVDLYGSTDKSCMNFMPVRKERLYIDDGYEVTKSYHSLSPSRTLKMFVLLIEQKSTFSKRLLHYYCLDWGEDEVLPFGENSFLQLIYYTTVHSDPGSPRNVLVYDRNMVSNRTAMYLYTCGLLKLSSTKCVDSKEQQIVFDELEIKVNGTFEFSDAQRDIAHEAAKRMNDANFLKNMLSSFRSRGGRDSFRIKAENILNSLLVHISSDFTLADCQYLCGQSIMMPVEDIYHPGENNPFLDLFPKPLTVSELQVSSLEQKKKLLNHAAEAAAKAKYLGILLEDAIVFGDKAMEMERPSLEAVGYSVAATFKAAASVPWGVFKSTAALLTWNRKHIVDVGKYMSGLFHYAFYAPTGVSTYPQVVQCLCERLNMQSPFTASLEEQERFIVNTLPSKVKEESLDKLIKYKDDYFKDSVLLPYVQGKSCGLVIFFLKTLYHCHNLRILRKSVTLVTISGIQNAGKTTLVKEIFGPDVVKAPTGSNTLSTTIFPSAYFNPNQRNVVYCDLPGCNDAETARICNLFLTLGDITVFLLPQSLSKNPQGDVYHTFINKVKSCAGPVLVCINSCDVCFRIRKGETVSDDELKKRLLIERDDWRSSSLFSSNDRPTRHSDDLWECEKGRECSVVFSTKDGHTSFSVWLTSFEVEYNPELTERLLFLPSHVQQWVQEVQPLCVLKNAE